MLKRRNIGKWLILIIFVSVLFSISASADVGSNDSSYTIPEYGPEFFNELKKNPHFITSRGSFPDPTNDNGSGDFFSNPVYKCWSNVTENDQFIAELDDPIIGFSYAGAGCIVVELESDSSEKVNETTIDEIYQRIDGYCEQEDVSEVPVLFMWSHIEEDLPLPDYGPQIFEEVKNEPDFIATRGTMPVITNASEKVEWEETAGKCIHSFRDELDSYMLENGGPLTGYGYNYRGYIFVAFDPESPESVNDTIIDEIYLIIEDHCEQKGVSEVPVVFEWIGVPIDDLAPADESDADEEMVTITDKDGNYIDVDKENIYIDKNGNFAIKDNETTQKTNEKANQAPGFTSIMVILGFLLLLIIKRST